MKNFFIAFSILLFLSLNFPMAASIAQPKAITEGIYKMQDLNLSPETSYTLQNNSPNEYSLVIIFDANQVVQELIQLPPLSDKYVLTPIQIGYLIVIIGKGDIFIS
jgi:hypothetical protein